MKRIVSSGGSRILRRDQTGRSPFIFFSSLPSLLAPLSFLSFPQCFSFPSFLPLFPLSAAFFSRRKVANNSVRGSVSSAARFETEPRHKVISVILNPENVRGGNYLASFCVNQNVVIEANLAVLDKYRAVGVHWRIQGAGVRIIDVGQ